MEGSYVYTIGIVYTNDLTEAFTHVMCCCIGKGECQYFPGCHARLDEVGNAEAFVLSLGILLAGTLLLGMLHRQREGLANAGWESITVIGLFLGGYIVLYFM